MSPVYYRELITPAGVLTLAGTAHGLCMVQFGTAETKLPVMKRKWMKHDPGSLWIEDENMLDQAAEQLEEYFLGERKEFQLDIDLRGTTFQKLVWSQLQLIPYGETRSYKEIAAVMGVPKAVRAVGGANNQNPLPIVIPCHSVVGANGSLVGYAGGLDMKTLLLEQEGVLESLSS